MSNLVVIIATIGRAPLVHELARLLERQTRLPDRVVVVGVSESDVAGVADGCTLPVEVLRCEKGLTRQRNHGLRSVADSADIVVFFDDDFVPRTDYLWQVEQAFVKDPTLVGITGRMIADGIHNEGYTLEQALALIDQDRVPTTPIDLPRPALYGCNMSVRMSAARGIWFDERLPLYGWQEDIDFTYQVGQRGHMVRADLPAGVHMGAKGGRQSGVRLGYSQVANPIYLLGKKTIPPRLAWRLMGRNLASNLVRSVAPESHIDRAGRLRGNLVALGHLFLGRLRPEHILEL